MKAAAPRQRTANIFFNGMSAQSKSSGERFGLDGDGDGIPPE